MMRNSKVRNMIFAALFAALICVATMVIRIPTPTSGYANLGDCIILLSAWMMGPIYGFFAAAIGSSLADIFSGYALYAPATFVVKGFSAVVAWALFTAIKKAMKNRRIGLIISGIFAEIVMVAGYFVFEAFIIGLGMGALAGIPLNAIQGVIGIIVSIIFMEIFSRTRITESLSGKDK